MAEAQAPALPGGTEAEWRAMVPREPKEANIGPGRKYKTRAAYEEAVAEWRQKKAARDELAPAREKAQAALRESRRAPHRDRSGLLPSGAAGRQKRKATSRSSFANELFESGNPELADIVCDHDSMEYDTMMEWAAGEVRGLASPALWPSPRLARPSQACPTPPLRLVPAPARRD